MKRKNNDLSNEFNRIEVDEGLQECINNLKVLGSSENQPLSPESLDYQKNIKDGLKILTEKYLEPHLKKSKLDSYCLLVNYESSLSENLRIYSDDSYQEFEIAKYVKVVLEKIGFKIITIRGMFQLHEFAQKRLCKIRGTNRLCRKPVHFKTGKKSETFKANHEGLEYFISPVWKTSSDGICSAHLETIRSLRHLIKEFAPKDSYSDDVLKIYTAYLAFLLHCDMDERTIDNLSLVLTLNTGISSGDMKKVINSYKVKKSFVVPFNLCVIAISDELSNEPLGTVMVFKDNKHKIKPKVSTEIHELTFEFANAVRKIELQSNIKHDTAVNMLRFFKHEAGHIYSFVNLAPTIELARAYNEQLNTLLEAVVSVYDPAKGTELKSEEFISKVEGFEAAVRACLAPVKLGYSIREIKSSVNWRYLFVLEEAIRNGCNHAAKRVENVMGGSKEKTLAEVEYSITSSVNEGLIIKCVSKPHELKNPTKVIDESQKIPGRGVWLIEYLGKYLNCSCGWSARKINGSNAPALYEVTFTFNPQGEHNGKN